MHHWRRGIAWGLGVPGRGSCVRSGLANTHSAAAVCRGDAMTVDPGTGLLSQVIERDLVEVVSCGFASSPGACDPPVGGPWRGRGWSSHRAGRHVGGAVGLVE